MSSKRQTTAYNRFIRVKARVSEVHAQTRHFSLTHDEHLAVLKARVYDSPDWKALRETDRAYLRGMMEVYRDQWYRTDLVWMHFLEETGEYVTPETFRAEGGDYRDIDKGEKSEHVWKHSGKGFGRVLAHPVRF